jgi:type II restriction/modification system DNA methylase subunit YeeA
MQTALTYRTNRDLFSNYYLDEHLPETDAWDELSDDELREKRAEIVDFWEREQDTVAERTESSLEEKFIRPLFRKLGIPFEVEETVQRGQRRPDYGFFPSEDAARDAFSRKKDGGDFYKDAVAVADAKRWGRPLDTRGSGEHKRDFENPSYQIHVYLQETPARWAVLTDGKKWRLYYGPTSHRLDSYYEIDLPTVLEKGDLEDFKYFYLFFRHGAFLEDSSGDCFLDDVYDESNVFAQELGEDLQDNIYEAIKILSEGFLQYPDNDLSKEDLDLVHDSSLIYLYRLIFVLYAESEGRDLLDTTNEIYEESYSLNSLKQDIAEGLDSANPKYRDWQDNLWDRLDELFKLIDQGSKSRGIPKEDLYIPAYNGGLFRTDPDEADSVEARFLANHQVGDAYLAEVIELLTRSQNGNGGGKIFVDYSSLDVRHLGSIYEGLLEYQLDVADEPLALEDGEYVSADEGDVVIVEEGEVHLTTGSGERKATGSYYTPEYVVEYIVEETLEPLVTDIRNDLMAQSARGERGFAAEFAERIFDLKILDPAMGSGHFLTSAIDYLAREIIDAQERQAAQEGIETVDEEHDINWARRQVAQRCIYGVDLNPLAVELAKVSLWLRTLAAEQPLAFLDHHLKTGNSLVGSDIETVLDNGESNTDIEEGQLTLQQSFDRTRQQALEYVTDQFEELLAIDNETLDDIKEMEAVYEEVREDPLYQHLIGMANVHTAEQFGLDIPEDAHERMAEALRNNSWTMIEEQDWYRSAQQIAADERFFHWELEFPIAFYEQDGVRIEDGGFDAVIGNPPYVRQEQITEIKPFLKINYDTYVSAADLYVYFIERGLDILGEDGRFGYITSNKFMRADYGTEIRSYLRRNSAINEVVDFGELPVFEDASTFPAILLLRNENSAEQQTKVTKVKSLQFEHISDVVAEDHYFTSDQGLSDSGWSLARKAKLDIQTKMESNGKRLSNYLDGEIKWGIKTGLNKAFVIDDNRKQSLVERDPHSDNLIEPLTVGDDVRRYRLEYDDRYLIKIPSGWTREQSNLADEESAWTWFASEYEAIADHLSEFETEARERYDQGEFWWELRPCDYYDVFDSPKLIYPEISMSPRFTIDFEGYYPNNKCFVTQTDDTYLLTLLNSTLLFEIAKLYVSVLGDEDAGGRLELRTVHVERLPIADPEPDLDAAAREKLAEDLFNRYREWVAGNSEESLISACRTAKQGVQCQLLALLGHEMLEYHSDRDGYNIALLDYLGIPSDELPDSIASDTLNDLQMPISGVADTPLSKTSEEFNGLRVEDVTFEDDSGRLVMAVDISYKVDDDDPRDTDRWDRLVKSEFESYEAMAFVGLSESEETLVREFVPVAVEKAGGFAGFRQDATKTNTPLDRLKNLVLPDIDNVRGGIEQYIDVKEQADELDKKIEKTDYLIDEIVYELYGLTDDEIEIVESAVQDD